MMAQEPDHYTPEQLQLMKTQDEKYIQMKLATENKVVPLQQRVWPISFTVHVQKVQRLKSCLHQTNQMAQAPPNTRTIFMDSVEEGSETRL